ncbi:MAG TPA: alkaline phosphatase family protein [Actinomycetota bacterium]|nr:alkaline phosphatase family protein [Actinomycetota bacterium]
MPDERGRAAGRSLRGFAVVGALAVLASSGAQQVGAQPAPADFASVACSLPHDQLLRIWRGTQQDRSGDVLIVPQAPNFVGSNYPHSGPWNYLQDVPMMWYGPGIVPALGVVKRPVTSADIAPTQAALMHFDGFTAPDGQTMQEVLPTNGTTPRLIVTFVWDAGGRNVLDAYPNDWPVLKSLIDKGVWFDHATVGSSPSITPATHATIGTGAFPMRTGQVDGEFRIGPDLIRAGELGPQLLNMPTLADIYDRARDNEPIIGTLGSVTWHLNMMSHGALFTGGDKDIAVLRTPLEGADNEGVEGTKWNLQGKNAPWYAFPKYANDTPPLSTYLDELDAADGARDGNWHEDDIQQLEAGWATPARIPYQDAMYAEVVKREGFGKDDVPDMLFINSKIIDHISHLYSTNSIEMQDTLRWQDEGLGPFIHLLNAEVGRGQWVLLLTADHGAQFDPQVSGAFQVTPAELTTDLQAAFGNEAVQFVRTSQIFLDAKALQQQGSSVEAVASFVLDYTKAQAVSDPSSLAADEGQEKVFAAAFPASVFNEDLPCLQEMAA